MARIPVLLTVLTLAGAVPCAGQLVVQGVRDLAFGAVLPGFTTTVDPTDAIRAGQFYVQTASAGTRIRIRFTLPNVLNGPGGATMPIDFSNNDGLLQETAPSSAPNFFNPKSTTNITLVGSADVNVWLGGKVSPAANQAVGSYSNAVVITVTVF